jgi:glucose-6-phosphate isomerase
MVKSIKPKIYLNSAVLGEYAQARQNITDAYEILRTNWQYKKYLDIFLESIDENFDLTKLKLNIGERISAKQNILYGIVIGIGGSNLFCQAVGGLLHIDSLVFLDSLNQFNLQKIISLIESWLSNNQEFKIFVISKSGSTLEVVVNFSVIFEKLKKSCVHWQNYLVVISDHGTQLTDFAFKHNLVYFPIKKYVGGRFSLFTAASIIPLAYIGLNTEIIKQSARCVVKNFFENPSSDDCRNILEQASCKYASYKAGKNLHNLFIFDDSAYYLGQWYRQLFAESLVKSAAINFVPTVTCAVDLHSMTQLHLAGTDQWWTIFLNKEIENKNIIVNNLFNKNIYTYQDYQIILHDSVYKAYEERQRSYAVLVGLSLETIGQICVSWILELFLLSTVFNVNPFDQPAVEYYKKNIYKKLKE